MNEVINGILNRRSIRAYKPDGVEREKLELIVKAGLYAPTAMNKQQVRLTVLQGEALEQLMGAIDTAARSSELAARIKPGEAFRPHYNAPALILASETSANHLGYADCSCALENMLIAASALGLGACWINCVYPLCDHEAVRAVLTSIGLPADEIVYGSVAVGYPDAAPREIERKLDRVIWA
ncbi:MAG: nitroreductase [Clostridia bacterium]|nr:nitroreductase [Clostridia bacterium]